MVMVVDMVVQVVLTSQVVEAMEVAGLVVMEDTVENLAGMAAVHTVVVLDLIEESPHLDTLVVMEEEAVVTTEAGMVWEVVEPVDMVVDQVICMVDHTVNQEVVMVDQVEVMEADTVVAELVGMVVGLVVLVEEAIEVADMTWVVLEAGVEEEDTAVVVAAGVEEARFMEEEEVEADMVAADGTILMEGRKFHKSFQSSSSGILSSCIVF